MFAARNGFRTNVNEMSDSRGTRGHDLDTKFRVGGSERSSVIEPRTCNFQDERYLVFFLFTLSPNEN